LSNKSLNILFLARETYPLNRIRLTDLFVKHFAEIGNKITWVLMNEKKSNNILIKKNNNNIFYITYSKGTNSRIKNFLNRFLTAKKFKISKKILMNHKIDIIIANDGIIEGFIAYLLSKEFKKPFAFYLSSLFFSFNESIFKEDRNLINLIKYIKSKIEKKLYIFLVKKCDIFHPISHWMGKYFSSYKNNLKIFPLPLCPSQYFINFNLKFNKSNDVNKLIYFGQITPLRKLDLLLNVFRIINDNIQGKENQLFFIGRIYNKKYKLYLEKKAKALSLIDSFFIIDEVPTHDIPLFVRQADIGLSILPPILGYRVSSPTKAVECLSLGIPIVGNKEVKDQKYVIEKSGGGISPKYDSNEIAKSIIYLLNNKHFLKKMGANGKNWVIQNRNYNKMARSLNEKYLSIIKEYQM